MERHDPRADTAAQRTDPCRHRAQVHRRVPAVGELRHSVRRTDQVGDVWREVVRRYVQWASLVASVCLATTVAAQDVTKPPVEGVRNFARLETTVACAGATAAEALPEIKKMGFVSVINLRLDTEPGAEVEKGKATATELGLRYFHVPFDGKPDPKAADAFITAITTPGAEPAFIHCAAGNRAATMWLIKRLVVDRWDEERAVREAIALGQTSESLRKFAIDYANKKQGG